jgi:hypothetical protein
MVELIHLDIIDGCEAEFIPVFIAHTQFAQNFPASQTANKSSNVKGSPSTNCPIC